MADTLEKGSLIIASRLSYINADVERGDIVIFSHPEIDEKYVVKRVIAVGGDTVEIKEGRVYLNESSLPLEENYVNEFSEDYMEKLTVPEGCLFVLGDNRRESVDSRYLDDRFVLAENVYAKVMFTLLPRIKKLY